jgi:hypothetical protein
MRRVPTSLILAATLMSCAPAELEFGADGEEPFIDSDGDGLSDSEEEALGTDPQSEDSDGDTYSDAVEDNSYTDPLDPADHPYAGGWPIDACRNDIVGEGVTEGQVLQDFVLLDQYGENLKLHDFCNHVVLIEHAGFG